MVLVSQPTHPAFYRDDVRHHTCNVCAADFNIPPPTRHELMATFTGAEIAALISEGCVIGSHRVFSAELERQLRVMAPGQALRCGYRHWIRGVYLITGVSEDDGMVRLPVRSDQSLDRLRDRLGESMSVKVDGETHTLVAGAGSLEGVRAGDIAGLRAALAALQAPAVLVLATGSAPDCGEDHVTAINLTRPVHLPTAEEEEKEDRDEKRKKRKKMRKAGGGEGAAEGENTANSDEDDDDEADSNDHDNEDEGSDDESDAEAADAGPGFGRAWRQGARRTVAAALARVTSQFPSASSVDIAHYRGGPCEPGAVVACVVPGGVRQGWTVVTAASGGLTAAVRLAHSRAARRCREQGAVSGGQTVRLVDLKARPELNGEVALALRFDPGAGRWLVRLRNGEGKQVRPENLEAAAGSGPCGRVMAFWGDARWSRAQLLGEIARGHWGLCRAGVGDITAAASARFDGLEGRVVFAPVTEMTEDFMSKVPSACSP
jgi:hypothetical protein